MPGGFWGQRRLPHAIPAADFAPESVSVHSLLRAYRFRLLRRRALWRAVMGLRALTPLVDRTAAIRAADVLCFSCVRNEAERLPHFLDHYRALGVSQFLFVDNGSDDGTTELLKDQSDTSVWRTTDSYRASRFGMDWINGLLMRHGSRHWCVTVDADELLVFDGPRTLPELASALSAEGEETFGSLILDMYPDGPLDMTAHRAGDDPLSTLEYFDPVGYRVQVQPGLRTLWIQGGPRDRMFFADAPEKAPTLNKIPFVNWHWRYAYVNSTHTLLPRRLNDWRGRRNGVLLHTKFLPSVIERAKEEKARGEHFGTPDQYATYYDAVADAPVLWHESSAHYAGIGSLRDADLFDIAR